MCESLVNCFMFMINAGLRSGGGIGDMIAPPSIEKEFLFYSIYVLFVASFWVIVIIIFLNVIFGIIIDTFADLRGLNKDKLDDMNNKCFICNIERSDFDRSGGGFNKHIKKEHNMWQYIFYMGELY